ncbi:DUF6115 domain-containing protein [Fictibacillus iocasae]|uniref:DUF6115 domain-containing protein n=1 Tax=Fictibacillus iocasae TaxID=2715437 RepID=A0ABW2NNJ4_9BACL
MSGFTSISLILHAAAFYFLWQLYKEKKDGQKQQQKMMSEMEDALALFTIDMQAENDRIIRKIEALNEQDHKAPAKEMKPEENHDVFSVPETENAELSSDQKKILQLAERGLDSTQIAKEMNRGKGEVDLLLKFYR